MEWLKNLSNAIEYIESHLDTEISYEEAARIACCSTYYFQRLFSYVAGISLSEYIRKRRMSQAAFELQRTDIKVLLRLLIRCFQMYSRLFVVKPMAHLFLLIIR